MIKPRILIQLDPDPHASVFDAVVAVDAHVDHLLQYSAVQPDQVRGLVHGAMFTRSPADLQQTAIFIGGTDVRAGERLLECVKETFFGPLRVSVMLDANGANTTAAAAVVAAGRHLSLEGAEALILAGTGPVGQRAARLLVQQGTRVRLASRQLARAAAVCDELAPRAAERGQLTPCQTDSPAATAKALDGVQVVIAAGAAGVQLLTAAAWGQSSELRVMIDLNAVPPAGIEGVAATDNARHQDHVVCYGAIGVGGTKMKIHRAALERLYSENRCVLDAEEIYALGKDLEC